jgi:hypothetical protein
MKTDNPITFRPTDLVVRLDEHARKVTFLVPNSPARPGDLKRFFEFELQESPVKEELANELGIALVAFMEATYMGFRFSDETVGNEDSGSQSGEDGSPSFEDARLLIDRIGDESSLADLEAIDAVLRNTAAAGDEESRLYLGGMWPKLRAVFVRRISRERSP